MLPDTKLRALKSKEKVYRMADGKGLYVCKSARNFFRETARIVTGSIDVTPYFMWFVRSCQFADIYENWKITYAD